VIPVDRRGVLSPHPHVLQGGEGLETVAFVAEIEPRTLGNERGGYGTFGRKRALPVAEFEAGPKLAGEGKLRVQIGTEHQAGNEGITGFAE
jgi:hypothetical protein